MLDQDIDKNDYELICVNDGSTDGSAQILARYAKQHSNIRIVTKENGGIASARNAGVVNAGVNICDTLILMTSSREIY